MSYLIQEQSNVALPQPLQHASQVHTSPRPVVPLPVNFDGIPSDLKNQHGWVLWNYENRENGKWTKPPRQLNGQYAKSNDPETWATFEEVRGAYEEGGFDGIGIVMRDGICGIDLDYVLSPDGRLESWAQEVVDQYAGTYIERSPSGDGVHILAKGKLPRCGKAGPDNRLEFYDERSPRYFTVTGHGLGATGEITDQQAAIDWLSDRYSKANEAGEKVQQPTVGSVTTLLADAGILANAMQVGGGERFRKLFEGGDCSDYPSQSEADLALATMLARQCRDGETLDRLFRTSALYRPEKWDTVHSSDGRTYGQMTIDKALSSDAAKANEPLDAPASQRRRTPIRHIADLMSERKSLSWLIEDTLVSNSLNQLFGPSGSGKSFVAIDWACSVATGQDWNGNKVDQGPVFYIAGEGEDGVELRVRAQLQRRKIEASQVPLFIIPEPIALKDGRNAENLADDIGAYATQHGAPRLIVIDTFARNFGNGDENLAAHVNEFIDKVDGHLRRRFGCAVLVVHHSGKGDKGQARGSTALRAAMNHDYSVDESGGRRVLRCHKNKEGPLSPDRTFSLDVEELDFGGDYTGDPVRSAVPLWEDEAGNNDERKESLSRLHRAAYQALKDVVEFAGERPDPRSTSQLGVLAPEAVASEETWKAAALRAPMSDKTFRRAIDALLKSGHVATDGISYWPKRG